MDDERNILIIFVCRHVTAFQSTFITVVFDAVTSAHPTTLCSWHGSRCTLNLEVIRLIFFVYIHLVSRRGAGEFVGHLHRPVDSGVVSDKGSLSIARRG